MHKRPLNWTDNPVEYLVAERYPGAHSVSALASLSAASFISGVTDHKEILLKAETYRQELNALPDTDVRERAEAAANRALAALKERLEKEERERFFNLESARADYFHWSRMSYWSLDEAVALLLSRDPRHVSWPMVKAHFPTSPFAREYSQILEIATRAKNMDQLAASNIPGFFLAWAARMQVTVPPELIAAIDALGIQVVDWKKLYDDQSKILEQTSQNLLKSTTERAEALKDHTKLIVEARLHRDSLELRYKAIFDQLGSRLITNN